MKFQSLCRGEASATVRLFGSTAVAVKVSIPLSRGCLCNAGKAKNGTYYAYGFQSLCRGDASATECYPDYNSWSNGSFNPSVEGKPLQPRYFFGVPTASIRFQSLCRGEASATTLPITWNPKYQGKFQSLCRGEASATLVQARDAAVSGCFNPSVEGKPLQH